MSRSLAVVVSEGPGDRAWPVLSSQRGAAHAQDIGVVPRPGGSCVLDVRVHFSPLAARTPAPRRRLGWMGLLPPATGDRP